MRRFLLLLLALAGCAAHPRRDPTGEMFPAVEGQALDGRAVRLPDAFRGAPVVLIVAYRQKAQFDVDRWVLGLLESDLGIPIAEVPAVRGLVPRLMSGWIDDGMRAGIPAEEWGAVVTVYGDAAPIARFTGDDGSNARVLLLDGQGRVTFFHDRGYSAATLLRLKEAARRGRRAPRRRERRRSPGPARAARRCPGA
jgi:hypothetical protein